MSAEQKATAIADKLVPAYRAKSSRYSCTGTIAKMWNAAYEGAHSALASQTAQPAEADGWVMVPRDLTYLPAMREVAWKHINNRLFHGQETALQDLWSAMLAAAPATPKAPTSTKMAVMQAWDAAAAECKRVAKETRFTDDVLPGDRGWYLKGVGSCEAMMRVKAHACLDGLFSTSTDAGGVEDAAKRIAEAAGAEWPHDANRYRGYAVAALATPPAPHDELRAALAWFSSQTRLSLYRYSPVYGDDDDQSVEWRVDRESGSINDREWDTIARGETAETAILAAHAAALKENPRG